MSNPISPDALPGGEPPGSTAASGLAPRDLRLEAASSTSADRRSDGVILRIARRWWVIVVAVFIAVVVAFAYLLITPAIYTATCVLAPERRLGGGGPGDLPPDEFLNAQRDLIVSPSALASAVASADTTARASVAASPQSLKDALRVNVSVGEQILVAKLDAPDALAASRALAAVADAYVRAQGDQRTSAVSGLAELKVRRDARAAERAAADKALNDYRATANLSGTDVDKSVAARLEQLNGALTAAQLELTNATAAAQAAQAMLSDPQKIAQTIEANRSKGIFAGLDQQKSHLQSQLDTAQALQQRQKQSMSPQHPKVMETQRQITTLKAQLVELDAKYGQVYNAYLEQQRLTAQRKVDELKGLIDEQSKANKEFTAKTAKLAELEATLKRADTALAEVDGKLRDLAARGGADGGAAPAMRLVQSPQVPKRPSRPDRVAVLSSALIVGLLGGLVLAALGKPSR
jgi:uncharacterized protein involved in exopolysaccharide biosynthesis